MYLFLYTLVSKSWIAVYIRCVIHQRKYSMAEALLAYSNEVKCTNESKTTCQHQQTTSEMQCYLPPPPILQTLCLYYTRLKKWILKLNSGTHVEWQVLTNQSAGQTWGWFQRPYLPLCGAKARVSESIWAGRGGSCDEEGIPVRQTDRGTDRRMDWPIPEP